MATNESSVVASLVAAQQWAASDEGRLEMRRATELIGKLRERRTAGLRAVFRLRRVACADNAGLVASAMRAHETARMGFDGLAHAHLGQLHGFPVSKEEMDHMVAGTKRLFDVAEHQARALGVDGEDAESVRFAGVQQTLGDS